MEMLVAYGGSPPRCACCGEVEYAFLALDHINGGGNAHRRQVGAGSTGVMYALRKAGWPPGYRVLCHNCNLAIAWYGRCPHVR
jgi:hypothetical protein